jgi:mono/diheme cytochrome c family protein
MIKVKVKVKFNLFVLSFFVLFNMGCEKKEEKSRISIQDIEDLKTRQYAIQGKVIYDNLCANCHQKDGTGLGMLIPPLAGADYLKQDIDRTIHIIKYGLEGDIMVNGIHFNQPMPPNLQLTTLEIAQIATYIYNVWGHNKGLITAKDVEEYIKE